MRSRWLDVGQVLLLRVWRSVLVRGRGPWTPKKNEANIQPSWPSKLDRSMTDLLHGKKKLSFGIQRAVPSGLASHADSLRARHAWEERVTSLRTSAWEDMSGQPAGYLAATWGSQPQPIYTFHLAHYIFYFVMINVSIDKRKLFSLGTDCN